MELNQGYIRPGKVLKVVDNYGTIKCSAVGVFSAQDNIEQLPPVYPFTKSSNTSFSKPQVGDAIWVILFRDNPQELFYMFQGDVKSNSGDILNNSYEDVEILSSRNSGASELKWSKEDGWNLRNNDSNINIDNDITISKSSNTSQIYLDDNGIHLRNQEGVEENQMVLGNHLDNLLKDLIKLLKELATTAKSNPNTASLGMTIDTYMINILNDYNQGILSKKNMVN